MPVPVRKTYFMLLVADMDRALAFYTHAFAAQVGFSSPYWSELSIGGAVVALHPGAGTQPVHTGLGFEVHDVDAALDAAAQAGGRIVCPRRDRPRERIRRAELAP